MASGNQIYVPITLGVDTYKKELAAAATATQQSGAQVANAAQKASEANLSAAKSTKTLQQEYRIAAKEAQKLAQIHGINNAATLEAAAKAAHYKDTLDDVNDRINAFHPEKRWQLAGQAMSGLVSLTQGVIGSMQALGVSSQSAAQALVAMNALQGFASALQGLEAMKGAYAALSVAIKTSVIPSLLTMNGLIMASGIGLIVAAVVALGYAMYKSAEATREAEKSLREYNATLVKTAQAEQDISIELLQGRERERAKLNNEATKKINEFQNQAIAIQQKASEESRNLTRAEVLEIESLRKQAQLTNQALVIAQSEQNKKFHDEDVAKYKEAQEKKAKIAKEAADADWKAHLNAGKINQDILQQRLKGLEAQKQAEDDAAMAASSAASNEADVPLFTLPNIDKVIEGNNYAEKIKEFGENTRKLVETHIGGAFSGVGTAIGQSLANGDDTLKAVGASIGKSLAELAVNYGASLIALSVPMIMAGQPLGFVYAAAGVGLIAAGSFISAKMGSGGTSGGGSSSSGGSTSSGATTGWGGNGGFNTGFGATANNLQLSTRVSGRDLEIVNGRQGYFSRRVTG